MLIHWKFRDSTELIGHLVSALPWSHVRVICSVLRRPDKMTGKFL